MRRPAQFKMATAECADVVRCVALFYKLTGEKHTTWSLVDQTHIQLTCQSEKQFCSKLLFQYLQYWFRFNNNNSWNMQIHHQYRSGTYPKAVGVVVDFHCWLYVLHNLNGETAQVSIVPTGGQLRKGGLFLGYPGYQRQYSLKSEHSYQISCEAAPYFDINVAIWASIASGIQGVSGVDWIVKNILTS